MHAENPSNNLPVESMTLKGMVEYRLFGPDGELKDYRVVPNLIVQNGFDFICKVMGDTAAQPASMKYIAIGSSSTAAATSDTALGSELARQLGTFSHSNSSLANSKTYSLDTTFAAGVGTGSVQESGMFNAASSGTMLNRQVFGLITKGALDSLQVTWTITLS